MEHNNQHIIKKSYAKPVIEEVRIDVAISLNAPTDPKDPIDYVSTQPKAKEPEYGEQTYRSSSSPFDENSKPAY